MDLKLSFKVQYSYQKYFTDESKINGKLIWPSFTTLLSFHNIKEPGKQRGQQKQGTVIEEGILWKAQTSEKTL